MSEAQMDHARRQLYSLVSNTHTRISEAIKLVEEKPAEARALLREAKEDIDRWLRRAGPMVGLGVIEELLSTKGTNEHE